MGKAHAGLLKNSAVRQHPRSASAPQGTFPAVFQKAGSSILPLQGRANSVLQGEEIGTDGVEVGYHVGTSTKPARRIPQLLKSATA